MQIPPFITLIFAFTSIMAHGQKAVEATLQNIIESETQAFTKMSFADVVKTFWLLDDKTLALVTIADGTQITANKDDILSNTSVPPQGHATF